MTVRVAVLALALLQLSVSFLLNGPSNKKGLAVTWGTRHCRDFEVLKGAHWWYDWSSQPRNYTGNCDTHLPPGYVPMVWGWHFDGRSNGHDFGHYDTVLGFNEPNHRHSCNLTYTQAARAWREVERQAGSRTLVSPAASPCDGSACYGGPGTWFTGFFQECQGCRVDYLATHFYGSSPDGLMSYLEGLWNKFHRKIWLTEFQPYNGGSPEDYLHFMQQVLPRLEAAPFVYRYSWYTTRILTHHYGNGSLLDHHAVALTELGRFYAVLIRNKQYTFRVVHRHVKVVNSSFQKYCEISVAVQNISSFIINVLYGKHVYTNAYPHQDC